MVNKQYNIHNTSVKNKSKSASPADDSDYTPSAFERNITQHYYQDNSDAFSDLLDDNCGDHKAATLSVQSVQPEQRSIFNVIATTDDHLITTTSVTTNTSLDSDSQKPLSINDIGRFQYILQMDREMVSACYVFFSVAVNSRSIEKDPLKVSVLHLGRMRICLSLLIDLYVCYLCAFRFV